MQNVLARDTWIWIMIKGGKATEDAKAAKQRDGGDSKSRLSLYPLDLETALRAAMQTGTPPPEARRPVKKKKKA
jgi:hypothetical protein